MWRPLFFSRFGGTEGIPVTFATEDFFNEYCERLIDPQPGDQVEVAWEGTFNLLDDDVVSTYAGRAWWSATIVECMEQHYKIHYPQWDASVWDEWVPRHRVRWPAREVDTKVRMMRVDCILLTIFTRICMLVQCVIRKGDVVEHKCQSSHGISPWLEALVTDAVGADGFRLGDVVLSDPRRVVQRSTLKLVHRPRGRLFNRFRASSHSRCVVM